VVVHKKIQKIHHPISRIQADSPNIETAILHDLFLFLRTHAIQRHDAKVMVSLNVINPAMPWLSHMQRAIGLASSKRSHVLSKYKVVPKSQIDTIRTNMGSTRYHRLMVSFPTHRLHNKRVDMG
jgi:hypothetical protein